MSDEMGLIVDIPKPLFDGKQKTNIFCKPNVASEISGLDFNFIYGIKYLYVH